MTLDLYTLAASSAHGLQIRAELALTPYMPPSSLTATPAYRSALARVLSRIAQGHGFDGLRFPACDIEAANGAYLLRCQALPYSQAVALDAARETPSRMQPARALFPLAENMGSATGAITAVLTAEGSLLTHQRSDRVGDSPLHWALGFGEGLDEADMGSASLASASQRCLIEELGLARESIDLERITLVALVRNNLTLVWDVFAVADFRGLNPSQFGAAAIMAKVEQAKDAWEHAQLTAVPFREIPQFIADKKMTSATPWLLAELTKFLTGPDPALKIPQPSPPAEQLRANPEAIQY